MMTNEDDGWDLLYYEMYPDPKDKCVHGVAGGCGKRCESCGYLCSDHEWHQDTDDWNYKGDPYTLCGCDFQDVVGTIELMELSANEVAFVARRLEREDES